MSKKNKASETQIQAVETQGPSPLAVNVEEPHKGIESGPSQAGGEPVLVIPVASEVASVTEHAASPQPQPEALPVPSLLPVAAVEEAKVEEAKVDQAVASKTAEAQDQRSTDEENADKARLLMIREEMKNIGVELAIGNLANVGKIASLNLEKTRIEQKLGGAARRALEASMIEIVRDKSDLFREAARLQMVKVVFQYEADMGWFVSCISKVPEHNGGKSQVPVPTMQSEAQFNGRAHQGNKGAWVKGPVEIPEGENGRAAQAARLVLAGNTIGKIAAAMGISSSGAVSSYLASAQMKGWLDK